MGFPRNPLTIVRADALYSRKRVQVECLSSDEVGDPMAARDNPVDGVWKVHRSDPFDVTRMPAFGILVEKTSTTTGWMQLFGPIEGIYSGLELGRVYFVWRPGNPPTQVPPTAGPSGYAMVQGIGVAVAEDILLLTGDLQMTMRHS